MAVPRCFLLACCAALSADALAAAPVAADDPIEAVGQAASQWIKIRTETQRLESEWRSEQVLLGTTLRALQERVTLLAEKRDQTKAKSADEQAELAALRAKAATLDRTLAEAQTGLGRLTSDLLRLRPALPPRWSWPTAVSSSRTPVPASGCSL